MLIITKYSEVYCIKEQTLDFDSLPIRMFIYLNKSIDNYA